MQAWKNGCKNDDDDDDEQELSEEEKNGEDSLLLHLHADMFRNDDSSFRGRSVTSAAMKSSSVNISGLNGCIPVLANALVALPKFAVCP